MFPDSAGMYEVGHVRAIQAVLIKIVAKKSELDKDLILIRETFLEIQPVWPKIS